MIRIFGLVFMLLVGGAVQAATINVSGCTSSTVQTAINTALPGDLVRLPAGCSSAWTGAALTINGKGITLDGNGSTITASMVNFNHMITVSTHATQVTRITGFTFQCSSCPNANEDFIDINTPDSDLTEPLFRVDHNTFNGNNVGTHVVVRGSGSGVIDHNTFKLDGNNEVIQCHGYGAGDVTGWNNDVHPGGRQNTYIEDNLFNNTRTPNFSAGKTEADQGCRQVVRYNTYHMAQTDQHGTGGAVAARWWEIYRNAYTCDGTDSSHVNWLQLRGGSGVAFGNTSMNCNGGGWGAIYLWEEDSGYPAAYQIGRGKCTGAGCASHPQTGSSEALTPVYLWDNANLGLTIDECDGSGSCNGTQIVANRDYYIATGNFTGASGVGAGPRSARPATCTTGVGYWSTDQGGDWDTTHGGTNDGCLDKCTATNTWSSCTYTPYTYPHPLVTGGALQPPSNLRTIQ